MTQVSGQEAGGREGGRWGQRRLIGVDGIITETLHNKRHAAIDVNTALTSELKTEEG